MFAHSLKPVAAIVAVLAVATGAFALRVVTRDGADDGMASTSTPHYMSVNPSGTSSQPSSTSTRASAVTKVAAAPVVPEAPAPGSTEIPDTGHDQAATRDTSEPVAKAGSLVRLSHLSAEWMPDLHAAATKRISESGRWSELAARLGIGQNDIVLVEKGATVTYDLTSPSYVKAIVVEGGLTFDPAKSTRMSVGTVLVSGGVLTVRPGAGNTAEISIRGEVDPATDPAQVLVGIVAVGGTVDIRGSVPTTPFVRVTGKRGDSTLTASAAPGWRVGQEVFITATNAGGVDASNWKYQVVDTTRRIPFPEEWEKARIASIDGTTIRLDRALEYDHDGYAAVLDRQVTIRTESGSPSRGHFMMAGNVKATVAGVRHYGLGRTTVTNLDDARFSETGQVLHRATNQQGRYALHAHHLAQEFLFEGNVVDGPTITRHGSERAISGSPKWGIVDHDSAGVVRGNVVIGAAGSGIVGEDGTETGEVVGNLVVGTGGGSGENDDERFGRTKGEDMGHGGFGFWFRGPFLSIRDNVAVGHFNQAAYLFFVHPDFTRNSIPDRPWIPADVRGKEQADLLSRNSLREFRGNRAEGYFGNGGLMIFYAQAPYEVRDMTLDLKGGSEARGVMTVHASRLSIVGSRITGGGTGVGIEWRESEPIATTDTTITGFTR